MVGYYDLVLGLVPLALLGITGLLVAAGVALTTAVPMGGGAAAVVVGHALFVNGPVRWSPTLPPVSGDLE